MEASRQSDTMIADRYRILARIGEGGFGTVYKARDLQQRGKIVAIKEINMAARSAQEKIEITDTFNREITMLSELRHKNLPRISHHFTDPEHWYIVMDYIEGQTLEELLAQPSRGSFSARQVIEIGTALCDVLSYLHSQNPSIIFRDVKPSNIMLTPWGHLYLIDFGIARRHRPGQVHDTGSLGSPGYAAPEQYGHHARTTPQTDIYGLGATLQTLLTGKEPLEIRQQGLPSNVRIPWKLQALFIQMMDANPSRRPRTMGDVKNSLAGLNTNKRVAWYLSFPVTYFYMTTLGLSGLLESAFVGLYFLSIPLLFVGWCIFALVRSWRTVPTRLSAKAMLCIAAKQFIPFLLVWALFTNFLSLLYIILVPPYYMTMLHTFYLWANGAVLIILLLVGLLSWLRRRQQKQKFNSHSLPSQVPLPLQQQKNP